MQRRPVTHERVNLRQNGGKLDAFHKILAMSGGGRYRLMSFLDVARQLGADGLISKPFTHQQILDEVHRLLEG
jgi:hypothetical protein